MKRFALLLVAVFSVLGARAQYVPFTGKPASVRDYVSGAKLPWHVSKDGFLTVTLPRPPQDGPDTVIEVLLR